MPAMDMYHRVPFQLPVMGIPPTILVSPWGSQAWESNTSSVISRVRIGNAYCHFSCQLSLVYRIFLVSAQLPGVQNLVSAQ